MGFIIHGFPFRAREVVLQDAGHGQGTCVCRGEDRCVRWPVSKPPRRPNPRVPGSELSPGPLANPQLTHVPMVSTHGSRADTSWGSRERRSAGTELSASVSRLESSLPVREQVPEEAGRRKGSNCSRDSWTLSLGWKGRSPWWGRGILEG